MPVAHVGVSWPGPPELGLYDHEYLTSPLQWPLNKGGALPTLASNRKGTQHGAEFKKSA